MRRIIAVLLFFIIGLLPSISANSNLFLVSNLEKNHVEGLADGWYEAEVKYSNYNTSTFATYTLEVQVKYGLIAKER